MNDGMTIPIAMTAERNNNITETFKKLSKKLFGFIKQRVKTNEDAEDILQEVFYQFAGNTEPIEQASSWLYKVATNKITDNYRKKKLPLVDDILRGTDNDDSMMDWTEVLLPDGNTPETAYLRNLFWEALQQALSELPAEQRDAFLMNEIEEIPFKDIETATCVSVATLISRKRYAVLHLRERLSVLKNELLNY